MPWQSATDDNSIAAQYIGQSGVAPAYQPGSDVPSATTQVAQNAGPTKTGLREVLGRLLGNVAGGGVLGLAYPGDIMQESLQRRQQAVAMRNVAMAQETAKTQLIQHQDEQLKDMVPIDIDGVTYRFPTKMAESILKQKLANQGKVDAVKEGNAPKYLKEGWRIGTNGPEQIPEAELSPIQKQALATSKAAADLSSAKAQLELAKNDPNSPIYKQAADKIMAARQAQWENLGLKREALDLKRQMDADGLTNTTKSMVEVAPKVKDLVNRVNQEIDQNVHQLGPAASRWNEFMAGKVGAPNENFTKLRTNVGLLTTLLMRMHVGARGGEYIMKHFQDLMNSGTQSPENLKAAIGEVSRYADDVINEGQAHGMNVMGGGSPNPTNPTKPSGRRVIDLTR